MASPVSEPLRNLPLPTLSSRYEIRQLTSAHDTWISAIQYHANIFHSPHKWSAHYHGRKTKATLEAIKVVPDGFNYATSAGMCFGVFDTEYVFKREESKALGGKLYFDGLLEKLGADGKFEGDDEDETLGDRILLEAMDFPLVSFALAHDDTLSAPRSLFTKLVEASPDIAYLYAVMDGLRAVEFSKAKEEGRFEETSGRKGWRLKRAGTATVSDHEGKGIMKVLTLWLLDYAEKRGYHSVLGYSSNSAVAHVWLDLPERIEGKQWKSKELFRVSARNYEQEVDDGKGGKMKTKPFEISGKGESACIEVELRPVSLER